MNVVTIERLVELLNKEVKNGNGKKKILLSNDDEGNGFHQMFYEITHIDEESKGYYSDVYIGKDDSITNYVILG